MDLNAGGEGRRMFPRRRRLRSRWKGRLRKKKKEIGQEGPLGPNRKKGACPEEKLKKKRRPIKQICVKMRKKEMRRKGKDVRRGGGPAFEEKKHGREGKKEQSIRREKTNSGRTAPKSEETPEKGEVGCTRRGGKKKRRK